MFSEMLMRSMGMRMGSALPKVSPFSVCLWVGGWVGVDVCVDVDVGLWVGPRAHECVA
jgi:hypothetical protein